MGIIHCFNIGQSFKVFNDNERHLHDWYVLYADTLSNMRRSLRFSHKLGVSKEICGKQETLCIMAPTINILVFVLLTNLITTSDWYGHLGRTDNGLALHDRYGHKPWGETIYTNRHKKR